MARSLNFRSSSAFSVCRRFSSLSRKSRSPSEAASFFCVSTICPSRLEMDVFRSAIFLVRSSFWPSRSAILASRLAISSLACSAAALASCSVLTSVAVTFSSLFDRPNASVDLVSRVFSRVSLTFFCSLSWSWVCTTSSDNCLILAWALRCSSTALAWRISRPTPSAMHSTTRTTIPVLPFIMLTMRGERNFGKPASPA